MNEEDYKKYAEKIDSEEIWYDIGIGERVSNCRNKDDAIKAIIKILKEFETELIRSKKSMIKDGKKNG